MDHETALELIRELEEARSRTALRCYRFGESQTDVNWLGRVVQECPIFDKVPDRVRDRLADTPARDLDLLGVNRRIRKRWKNEGAVVHLYAGKKEGYDLTVNSAKHVIMTRIAEDCYAWLDQRGDRRTELQDSQRTCHRTRAINILKTSMGPDELDEVERAKCHLDEDGVRGDGGETYLFGLNMEFTVPEDRGPLKAFLKAKHQVSSSDLARWVPDHINDPAKESETLIEGPVMARTHCSRTRSLQKRLRSKGRRHKIARHSCTLRVGVGPHWTFRRGYGH